MAPVAPRARLSDKPQNLESRFKPPLFSFFFFFFSAWRTRPSIGVGDWLKEKQSGATRVKSLNYSIWDPSPFDLSQHMVRKDKQHLASTMNLLAAGDLALLLLVLPEP
jgi:hypothetical protein